MLCSIPLSPGSLLLGLIRLSDSTAIRRGILLLVVTFVQYIYIPARTFTESIPPYLAVLEFPYKFTSQSLTLFKKSYCLSSFHVNCTTHRHRDTVRMRMCC